MLAFKIFITLKYVNISYDIQMREVSLLFGCGYQVKNMQIYNQSEGLVKHLTDLL